MVVFDQRGREVTKDYNQSKAELHTFLGDLSGKLKDEKFNKENDKSMSASMRKTGWNGS